MTRLIKNGRYAADSFTAVADDAALPSDVENGGAILVSLARFQNERDTLLARNTPIGVRLTSGEDPAALGDAVNRLSLVVLDFPKFRDGRPFSWARRLRTRMGFTGEIRATGDFLLDQIAYQHRTGFDAWEVPDSITPEMIAHALAEMTDVYQPSADGKKTISQLRGF